MADPKKPTFQSESPYQFAAHRFGEMNNLLKVLREPKQTKLVFQSLPKHMRRRAATQNPNRLPRRLRAHHRSQFRKSGAPVKSKRPTRKYRRKPVNLRKEYEERASASKNKWLETHLWHAKRFHMVSRWGYRLPWSPCDKSYRACYRAVSKYCLLQDLSYMATLQIRGPLITLKEGFSQMTSTKCGPTLNAKCFANGSRQGHVYLFKAQQYPLGCLGRVSFQWLPQNDPEMATIWITVHPAFLDEVKREFSNVFQLTEEGDIAKGDRVEMTQVESLFSRFRLSGPKAQIVLKSALNGIVIENRREFPIHSTLAGNVEVQRRQQQFWESVKLCSSVHEVPSNMILPLTVEDPRLNRPNGRQPIFNQELKNGPHITEIPSSLLESPFFRSESLLSLKPHMMSTSQYCKARNSAVIVPGQRCPFENDLQAIPIILIQRPGQQERSNRSGFNAGWEVLIPKGYGSIFWLSFIMWGGRAGGLRESLNTERESKTDPFIPDTSAGQRESAEALTNSRKAYFERPFNKRENYIKLGIASPFCSPWKQLVAEWGGNGQQLYVIRDRTILCRIQEYLKGNNNQKSLSVDDFPNSDSALVPISFRMGRGNCGPNSIICLPNPEDNIGRNTTENGPIYSEPPHRDPLEGKRKLCRSLHLRLLRKMRSKRTKAKKRLQRNSTAKITVTKPMAETLIATQHKKMCELWLPSKVETVRNQCSRPTIGHTVSADFSFVAGSCSGVGYVTLKGLLENKSRSPSTVLIRSTNSRHYRLAQISVNEGIIN